MSQVDTANHKRQPYHLCWHSLDHLPLSRSARNLCTRNQSSNGLHLKQTLFWPIAWWVEGGSAFGFCAGSQVVPSLNTSLWWENGRLSRRKKGRYWISVERVSALLTFCVSHVSTVPWAYYVSARTLQRPSILFCCCLGGFIIPL